MLMIRIVIIIHIYISADLFQSSSVLAYSCNPPMPSCRLQPHHPAACILLCRIQPTLYHLKGVSLICHRAPQAATGRQTPSPPHLPLAWKSVVPPAQECQIAHLGTLATPMTPKWHQRLAADTKGGQRPPKCDSNSCQICQRPSKKTSIQASKHPSLGSQRSAAEAVAFSIICLPTNPNDPKARHTLLA